MRILLIGANARKMNDGERTIMAIKLAEGKRLMYKEPLAN